jgi:hypothetical protein
MKLGPVVLYFSAALLACQAASTFPVTYEGGTIPLRHDKVTATIDQGTIVFLQHGRRVAVPVENVTAISYSSDVHRRFGAPVLGMVPFTQWDKAETNYVGVTWKAGVRDMQVLFKLNSREYRDFLGALEASTGKKAVNPQKVPVVVRYGISPTTI